MLECHDDVEDQPEHDGGEDEIENESMITEAACSTKRFGTTVHTRTSVIAEAKRRRLLVTVTVASRS